MKRFALTAIGRDRPGIVAAVTKALYENNCNIEDSSMTILEDEFAIILIMSAPGDIDKNSLSRGIKLVEKAMGLTVHLKEIPKEPAQRGPQSNYIITLHGADRAGIVYKTAAALSERGINITDLETKTLESGDKNIYIMLMEVFLPAGVDLKAVEAELKGLGESLGVTIRIKPVEAYEPL